MPSAIPIACAALAAAIFALLGAVHVYWALGGRRGVQVSVPARRPAAGAPERPVLMPASRATWIVALLLFAAAAVMLSRAGWLPWLPVGVSALGAWALAGLFVLRAVGDFRYVGFFKTVRGTRFARWDSALFSPLCLVVAVLAGTAAWLAP